ncbi:VID27-like protein [Engraulis encrasicolus]|uniref:VID27-like protein n=1 Tax=Engraulis encrasicolus TaxID=184585 RepID=UPI002FD38DA9
MDLLGADQEEKRSEMSVSLSHTRTDTEAHGESSVAFSEKGSYLHSEAFIHRLDECIGEGDEEGGQEEEEDGEEEDEEEDEEEVRMLKLRRHLDQLDALYSHTEESMLHTREELHVCAERIAELQGERQALEELTHTHTQQTDEEEDSASVFAMRVQLKSVCEDLHSQEELHTHLAMELRQYE